MSESWVVAGPVDAVIEGEPIAVTINGFQIALYRVDDTFYATDGMCSHGSALLCDGFQEGHEIECPLHQGRFDVRDGRALCEPLVQDVRAYATRVEDGNILINMDPSR